jgi:ribonuclease HII
MTITSNCNIFYCMSVVMGIDEAGRGPVLGPMVIAGVALDEQSSQRLVALGLKDSKKLSPKKRELMFELINKDALWIKTVVVWPKEIDASVRSHGLNQLERDKFVEIINEYQGTGKIIIDSPQTPAVFTAMINEKLTCTRDILCSFKADTLYPEVSAASVVAKFTRDSIIEELKLEFGDFGSGYPSDPKTRVFLTNIKETPHFVRTSWKTYSELSFL